VAAAFLPRIGAVFAAKGVEMRCCPRALALLGAVAGPSLVAATEQTGRGIPGAGHQHQGGRLLDEAIAHINRYGSHHTDAILTTTTRMRSASCARWTRPA
jgi:glutamate-5-semialdehyde dehydrogenase